MTKKEFAESITPTLHALLLKMQSDLKAKDQSREYSKEYLKGFSDCSYHLMDYLELMLKESL
jgi:hypothetical protein